jgi:tetratricopeptide (TPR) repeat protein
MILTTRIMMNKRNSKMLALLLILFPLTGCMEKSEPEKVIHEYLAARKDGDYAKAFTYLTERSQRGEPFEEFEKYCLSRNDNFSKIKTKLVEKSDTTAQVKTAISFDGANAEYDVWLLKVPDEEDSREVWKILHNDVLINQAQILYNEEKYRAAANMCEAALYLNPYDINGYNILGNCYSMDFRITRAKVSFQAAVKAFEKALSFEPQSTHHRADLAMVYAAGLNFKRAREILEEALEITPEHKGLPGILREMPYCNGVCGILELALILEKGELNPKARTFMEENPTLFPARTEEAQERLKSIVQSKGYQDLKAGLENYFETIISIEGNVLRHEEARDKSFTQIELEVPEGGTLLIFHPWRIGEMETGTRLEVKGLPASLLTPPEEEEGGEEVLVLMASQVLIQPRETTKNGK